MRGMTHVFRRLIRSPLFTAMTLLTLAIGIGANTAIFSVIDGVLLRPLPYPHPEELVGIWHTAPGFSIKNWRFHRRCTSSIGKRTGLFKTSGFGTRAP